MQKIKSLVSALVIILLSYWAVKYFFVNGFFPMHDDTQVARIYEMHKSLADGMFPVRWVSDLGYGFGYPIFNFYAPLPYYLGALAMFMGFDALSATKIAMVLGILFAGMSMFLLTKDFWGRKGAIISALFYIYATYHAVDIYVRGDVSEFFAYAFTPLAFYGIYKSYKKKSLKMASVGSIGIAGVVLSHNLSAFMLFPFVGVFILGLFVQSMRQQDIKKIAYPLFSAAIGMLVSAFYILPVIFEAKYTNVLSQVGGSADFRNHFVCLAQLWSSPWGYGGSVAGCVDGLSFMLGKIYFLFAIVGLLVLFTLWKKQKEQKTILILSFLGILISVFMLIDWSAFLWKTVPFLPFIQYPWRYLLFVSFFCSIIAGSFSYYINSHFTNKKIVQIGLVGIVIVCLLFFQAKFFTPQKINPVTSSYYINAQMLKFTTSKVSDEYLPTDFLKPKNLSDVPVSFITLMPESGVIINSFANSREKRATVDINKPMQLTLNIAYFPAWYVNIDGKEVTVTSDKGKISVIIPGGKHEISVKYVQTPIEQTGNFLSLAGLVGLFIGIILGKRKLHDKTS